MDTTREYVPNTAHTWCVRWQSTKYLLNIWYEKVYIYVSRAGLIPVGSKYRRVRVESRCAVRRNDYLRRGSCKQAPVGDDPMRTSLILMLYYIIYNSMSIIIFTRNTTTACLSLSEVARIYILSTSVMAFELNNETNNVLYLYDLPTTRTAAVHWRHLP